MILNFFSDGFLQSHDTLSMANNWPIGSIRPLYLPFLWHTINSQKYSAFTKQKSSNEYRTPKRTMAPAI